MKVDNLQALDDKEMLQQYTNECAHLGNTQTMIHELKEKMKSIVKDLEFLDKKYNEQVSSCLQIKREIDRRGKA